MSWFVGMNTTSRRRQCGELHFCDLLYHMMPDSHRPYRRDFDLICDRCETRLGTYLWPGDYRDHENPPLPCPVKGRPVLMPELGGGRLSYRGRSKKAEHAMPHMNLFGPVTGAAAYEVETSGGHTRLKWKCRCGARIVKRLDRLYAQQTRLKDGQVLGWGLPSVRI